MSGNNRGNQKQQPRDQQVSREVRQDVGEEIRSSGTKPLIRQPNRDQTRGDSDRTGDHQDVDTSRAPEEDEGFDERS
jgi:hypothetical protein